MINRFDQKSNVSRLDVFDGSTFQAKYSWVQSPPLYGLYSISDHAIAAVRMPQQKGILYSEFASGKWRLVGNQPKGDCSLLTFIDGLPNFTSNEHLLIRTGAGLCLTDLEGHFEALSKIDGLLEEKIVISQDGRFIAMSLGRPEIKKRFLAEPSMNIVSRRIAVYDLATRKWALTVDVAPLPKNDYDFALSPNGSKLAILIDLKASAYSVPVQ
jgi:hypothetical protein